MSVCADVGLVAKKEGSMRMFMGGQSVQVTVLTVEEQTVADVMTPERNGYKAVQVAAGSAKLKRTTRAIRGHLQKSGLETARVIKEFRLADSRDMGEFEIGKALDLKRWETVAHVNVQATTKGKGFAGCVKRHHFKTQDATHGNSLSHRAPGSIGQCQDPGRVFKGKKMAGHMGAVKRTLKNLEVVGVRLDERCLIVKGSVPGAKGSTVLVVPTQPIASEQA